MKRNLLLITTDQHRWDAIGPNCGWGELTPHLSALAREGANFPLASSSNPICVPARLSLLTGCAPHRVICGDGNDGVLREGVPTLPGVLASAGYATAAIGKMHFLPYQLPRTLHGFQHAELYEEGRVRWKEMLSGEKLGGEDYLDALDEAGWGGYQRAHGVGNNDIHLAPSALPAEQYESSWVARRSLDWIRGHRASHPDQPFFLWTSFTKPHAPFDPPEPWHKCFDPRDMPLPAGSAEMLANRNPALARFREAYLWNDIASPQVVALARAYYFGLVRFIDEQIGRIFQGLREESIWENTSIIFTSDHGEMLGDFGLFFKSNHLEGSGHVPLIMKLKDRVSRDQAASLRGIEDVFPTLLHEAELDVPVGIDGITPLASSQRGVYFSHTTIFDFHSFMARTARHKYIWSELGGSEELYDLEEDPQELINLAKDPARAAILKGLKHRLSEWLVETGNPYANEQGRLIPKTDARPLPDAQAMLGLRWC